MIDKSLPLGEIDRGTYQLILDTGFQLNLTETFYVPSISINLISLSKVDNDGFVFNFGLGVLSINRNNIQIGSGFECDS